MREKVSITYLDDVSQSVYIIPNSFQIFTYNNYICTLENGSKVYLNREQVKVAIISQEE